MGYKTKYSDLCISIVACSPIKTSVIPEHGLNMRRVVGLLDMMQDTVFTQAALVSPGCDSVQVMSGKRVWDYLWLGFGIAQRAWSVGKGVGCRNVPE